MIVQYLHVLQTMEYLSSECIVEYPLSSSRECTVQASETSCDNRMVKNKPSWYLIISTSAMEISWSLEPMGLGLFSSGWRAVATAAQTSRPWLGHPYLIFRTWLPFNIRHS